MIRDPSAVLLPCSHQILMTNAIPRILISLRTPVRASALKSVNVCHNLNVKLGRSQFVRRSYLHVLPSSAVAQLRPSPIAGHTLANGGMTLVAVVSQSIAEMDIGEYPCLAISCLPQSVRGECRVWKLLYTLPYHAIWSTGRTMEDASRIVSHVSRLPRKIERT